MYANTEIIMNSTATEITTTETTKKSIWQRLGKAVLSAFAAFGLSAMHYQPLEANEYFHCNYQNLH